MLNGTSICRLGDGIAGRYIGFAERRKLISLKVRGRLVEEDLVGYGDSVWIRVGMGLVSGEFVGGAMNIGSRVW